MGRKIHKNRIGKTANRVVGGAVGRDRRRKADRQAEPLKGHG